MFTKIAVSFRFSSPGIQSRPLITLSGTDICKWPPTFDLCFCFDFRVFSLSRGGSCLIMLCLSPTIRTIFFCRERMHVEVLLGSDEHLLGCKLLFSSEFWWRICRISAPLQVYLWLCLIFACFLCWLNLCFFYFGTWMSNQKCNQLWW